MGPLQGLFGPKIRQQTLAYGQARDDNLLDLYRPRGRHRMPFVVIVHGGAWRVGRKGDVARVARKLAGLGFAAASVNYRKLPGATIQQSAEDVAAAACYLLAHADEFGLSDRRFALVGHSSGGHLAALVAADPAIGRATGLDMSRLAALITLDGVFDLRGERYDGQLRELDEAARSAISPLLQTGPLACHPAFCFIHTGSNTEPRFGESALAYGEALRARGENVVTHYAAEANHRSVAGQFDDPEQPMAGWAADCLRRALGI